MVRSLLTLALLAAAVPQDPAPQPSQPPPEPQQVVDARAALEKLAKRLEGVKVLSASYVQTQESMLLKEPIVTRGRMYLRARPGCLLLLVEKPTEVHIRSDETSHQIYYPARKRAERLLFENNELATALLSCFGPDVRQIEKTFAIQGFERGEKESVIRLVPREDRVKVAVTSPFLTISHEGPTLIGMAHTNPEGEAVRFELSDVKLDPKLGDPRALFDAALPKDVQVVVHRVPAPKPPAKNGEKVR